MSPSWRGRRGRGRGRQMAEAGWFWVEFSSIEPYKASKFDGVSYRILRSALFWKAHAEQRKVTQPVVYGTWFIVWQVEQTTWGRTMLCEGGGNRFLAGLHSTIYVCGPRGSIVHRCECVPCSGGRLTGQNAPL